MPDTSIIPRKLAILIFDNVEVLDFAGPFEVFAVTRAMQTRRGIRSFRSTPSQSIAVQSSHEMG
jgi:transcriptional regulator GlxA family with amidase domain